MGTFTVKLTSVLDSSSVFFGMKVKQRGVLLFLKINTLTIIQSERSHRELPILTVVHLGIFKNNQFTLFPCFTLVFTVLGKLI